MKFGKFRLALVCAMMLAAGCSSSSGSKGAADMASGKPAGNVAAESKQAVQSGGAVNAAEKSKADSIKLGVAGQNIPSQRKMIYTINLSLKVSDVDAVLKKAEQVVSQTQGYLSRLEKTSDGFASVELRIPAAAMGEAIDSLKAMGTVANERKSGQDVTEEYVDVEARIKALKVEEERLLELVTKGAKLDEILQVERELTRVRGEIEQAQGRIKLLDNKIDYATIQLQIEKAKPLDNESPQNVANRAWNGLVDNLQSLLNLGKELLIWIASHLFTLLLLVGIGYVVYRKIWPVYKGKWGGPKGPTPPDGPTPPAQ